MTPTTLRRVLLVSLVIAAAIPLLTACATPDVQCQMRADYSAATPVPSHGRVTFAWAYGAGFPGNQYGEMLPTNPPIIRLRGEPPTFNDVCKLAQLGHEVAHAMGARH